MTRYAARPRPAFFNGAGNSPQQTVGVQEYSVERQRHPARFRVVLTQSSRHLVLWRNRGVLAPQLAVVRYDVVLTAKRDT